MPSSGNTARRMNRFVLEFKDDAEFIDLMVFMIESGVDDTNARPDDIVDCVQPLIGDSKEKNNNLRRKVTPTDSHASTCRQSTSKIDRHSNTHNST